MVTGEEFMPLGYFEFVFELIKEIKCIVIGYNPLDIA